MRLNRVAICSLVVFACARGHDRSANLRADLTTRRDSAGIEVVENAASSHLAMQWTVDSDPFVTIGARDGSPDYLLANVVGVTRLNDGRIVVAESDARLRFYDSAGKHLVTISRSGHGPGEISQVARMFRFRGDSILLVSSSSSSVTLGADGGSIQNAKVVLLDADGNFGRQSQLTLTSDRRRTFASPFALGIEGITGEGELLLRRAGVLTILGERGPRWRHDAYVKTSFDGSATDTVTVRRCCDIEEMPELLPLRNALNPHFMKRSIPVALDGQRLYWGNGEEFAIHTFELTATANDTLRPTRVIRYALPGRPGDHTALQRYLSLLLTADSTLADSLERIAAHKQTPARATLPAFQSLLTDSERNLWVEHSRISSLAAVTLLNERTVPDDDTEENAWTIFDSTGAVLGRVVTPRGLKVSQIGSDWLLGIHRDADDVPYIRIHRIRKSG